MERSFARVLTPGGFDIWNPVSVWATKQSFDNARRQGSTLVRLIDQAESGTRSRPRIWSPTPIYRPARGRIDVTG